MCQDCRWDVKLRDDALQLLQLAAEAAVVDSFGRANMLAVHAQRATLMARDMMLVVTILQSEHLELQKELVVRDAAAAARP